MSKKKPEQQTHAVTAEDAERMFAQAYPAKKQAVASEVQAALNEIGARHNVDILAQIDIRWPRTAAPVVAKLPETGAES